MMFVSYAPCFIVYLILLLLCHHEICLLLSCFCAMNLHIPLTFTGTSVKPSPPKPTETSKLSQLKTLLGKLIIFYQVLNRVTKWNRDS